jgi:hypothetical protein
VRLEVLGRLKNPITSGIKPATFQLVAKCHNQLCYRIVCENKWNIWIFLCCFSTIINRMASLLPTGKKVKDEAIPVTGREGP